MNQRTDFPNKPADANSESELRQRLNVFLQEWIYDEMAQVAPKRHLEGNNFDMLVEGFMALFHQQLEAKVTEVTQHTALLQSDLAWCLGKLRGLGHPAEQIEKRHKLTDQGGGDRHE